LVMGFGISAAVAYLSASWSSVALTGMIFGYLVLPQYLLAADGLLLGVLFPIAMTFITYSGLTTYRLYLTEEREKRLLAHAAIADNPKKPLASGRHLRRLVHPAARTSPSSQSAARRSRQRVQSRVHSRRA
jgi:hypothetical protein